MTQNSDTKLHSFFDLGTRWIIIIIIVVVIIIVIIIIQCWLDM